MRLTLAVVAIAALAACSDAFFFSFLNRFNRFRDDAPTGAPIPPLKGGGDGCAECTLVIKILKDYSVIHDKTIAEVISNVCDLFPKDVQTECKMLVDTYGPVVIQLLEAGLGPDATCQKVGFCKDYAKCILFPKQHYTPSLARPLSPKTVASLEQMHATVGETPWQWLVQQLERVFNTHTPLQDMDGDKFSDLKSFRGSDWRGADCNDFDQNVYPGRAVSPQPSNPYLDHNCNGISGVNPKSGRSYEDDFCAGSGQLGVIALGDSATAHFRLPVSWFNASLINKSSFDDLLYVVSNEGDWPHLSGTTGHENDTTGLSPGSVDSIYFRLFERNRCNHRDFQNIGVNGARVGSMANNIVLSMARDQKMDQPAVVFHALVGNDVCGGHHTFDTFTTPAEFEASVLKTLAYLDTKLAKGSTVFFIGLVDGRILWNTLHAREHPVGDVTYEGVYDYLNCLGVSPCWGWMNSNETVRNITSEHAALLSGVYAKIMSEYKSENFAMHYYDFAVEEALQVLLARGGQAWQIIEPVDGFHPSQVGHAILAEIYWERILKEHPEALGTVNPHNADIEAIFGDQGGY